MQGRKRHLSSWERNVYRGELTNKYTQKVVIEDWDEGLEFCAQSLQEYSILDLSRIAAANGCPKVISFLRVHHTRIGHVQNRVYARAKSTNLSYMEYPLNVLLSLAVGGDHIRVVELIIRLGANIFEDVIILAGRNNNVRLVRLLFDCWAQGWDEEIGNKEASEDIENLFTRAVVAGHTRIVRTISTYMSLRTNTICNALRVAASSGRINIVKYLCENYSHDVKKDLTTEIALARAAEHGRLRVLKYMIGCFPEDKRQNYLNEALMRSADCSGKASHTIETMEWLRSQGAKITTWRISLLLHRGLSRLSTVFKKKAVAILESCAC